VFFDPCTEGTEHRAARCFSSGRGVEGDPGDGMATGPDLQGRGYIVDLHLAFALCAHDWAHNRTEKRKALFVGAFGEFDLPAALGALQERGGGGGQFWGGGEGDGGGVNT
jgi:hypothetical protein